MGVEVIKWREGTLSIVDQTRLPNQLQYIDLKTVDAVVEAIRQLRVRGAPAIGVCAAYGILVGIRENGSADSAAVIQAVEQTAARLAATRPTAVNLFWALDRMRAVTARAEAAAMSKEALYRALEAEAAAIDQENVALCEAIGRTGAPLVTENAGVLTHCNAGALATAGAGTALAPLFRASEEGRRFTV
ncbi:MAG: S-methyl-5-thioribose-1-phosphate isomerase, partial [Candidatus Hydrogenedentes bacterium]|nr:S-methyl-5-thioribose-1-phosphate isomerase [Candidatus Hydrogenedentota bacterium]